MRRTSFDRAGAQAGRAVGHAVGVAVVSVLRYGRRGVTWTAKQSHRKSVELAGVVAATSMQQKAGTAVATLALAGLVVWLVRRK